MMADLDVAEMLREKADEPIAFREADREIRVQVRTIGAQRREDWRAPTLLPVIPPAGILVGSIPRRSAEV